MGSGVNLNKFILYINGEKKKRSIKKVQEYSPYKRYFV